MKEICILPQRLLQVQLTFTYLGVGWQKINLPDWQGGEILTYSFIGRWGTELGYYIGQLPIPLVAWDWVTHSIIFFEFILPFGLWHKPTQKIWMIGGVLFHVGIALILSIWWFVMVPPLYILWLMDNETKKKVV